MSDEPTLSDPYASLPKGEKTITSITVSNADRAFLFGLYPHQSVVQYTMNNLLVKFVAQLKAKGLTGYVPGSYDQVMDSLTITIKTPKAKVKKPEPETTEATP